MIFFELVEFMEKSLFKHLIQMNHKIVIVLHVLMFLSLQLLADAQWYPGIAKVYESDVIVEASYVRQTDDHFWIKIKEVLRGEKYGLEAGDYVRVNITTNGSCGFSFKISDYDLGRFYLKKLEGTWQLLRNSSTGLDHLKAGTDSTCFHFGSKSFNYLKKDFNRNLIEFQTCYEMYSEGWGFYTIKPDEFIIRKTVTNRLIKHFEDVFRSVRDLQHMNHRLVNMFDERTNTHRMVWSVDQLPLFDGGRSNTALLSYLSSNVKSPIVDSTKQHSAFVSLLILKDGSIGEIEFPYFSHITENDMALEIIEQMPLWKAALLNEESVSCWVTIPVNLNLLSSVE